ncbi:MAG: T9SS type A sorting domain-containing protein, partial [Bacteroidota bacterium]|nr:T9SS type A sorting domain-containing protein [Bacteroidota bacterium]
FILRAKEITTFIKGIPNVLPNQFELFQNFPNPFNPSTTISYYLPANSIVTLKVYDPLGREIETLVNGYQGVGMHTVLFNARNFPSGVYFYSLRSLLGRNMVRKMILTK